MWVVSGDGGVGADGVGGGVCGYGVGGHDVCRRGVETPVSP